MVFAFMVKIQQILYYQLVVDTLKPNKSILVKILLQHLMGLKLQFGLHFTKELFSKHAQKEFWELAPINKLSL